MNVVFKSGVTAARRPHRLRDDLWIASVVVVLGAGIRCASAAESEEPDGAPKPRSRIAALKLTPDRLPKGWAIVKEQEAAPEQLPAFEQRLGAKITGIVSQLLESKKGKVQLNYVSFLIPDEMTRAYQVMQQRARGTVTVIRVGRVAIEIGATSEPLKALATGWFPLSKVQSLKIKQHQVSGKWLLTDETIAAERELQREAADYGVKLADKLSQFFLTKTGAGVRIDLFEPTDPAKAQQLQGALLRAGDLRNKLLTLNGCVAQISANDARARAEAERLLKANVNAEAAKRSPAQAGE